MQRITVTLTDEQADRLRREARRRRTSVSEVVRQRLERPDIEHERRVIPWLGIVKSARAWSAEDVDSELARTWADHIRADR